MQVLPIERRPDQVAELKLQIIQQRQLAAELCRKGDKERARAARWKLFALLNELDLMCEADTGGNPQLTCGLSGRDRS